MQFLTLLGLVAAAIPACVARCPHTPYYLETGGNYAVTAPATDEDRAPFALQFSASSTSEASKYTFFKNHATKKCQLTFAGTTHGPSGNQSITSYYTTDGGPTDGPEELFIAPSNYESSSKVLSVEPIACQATAQRTLACTVSFPNGVVYNLFELYSAPYNTLLIANSTTVDGSGVTIKLVKA